METMIGIADAVRRGEKSAVSAVEACLAAIQAHDEKVNAFVHIDRDGALRAAEEIDEAVKAGQDPGPLAGVPFGIKDLRDSCAGMPTKNGSLITRKSVV